MHTVASSFASKRGILFVYFPNTHMMSSTNYVPRARLILLVLCKISVGTRGVKIIYRIDIPWLHIYSLQCKPDHVTGK